MSLALLVTSLIKQSEAEEKLWLKEPACRQSHGVSARLH
jgi:hypothetical protein